MANKAYESYEMLARLLNSQRKENIDRAYDALSAALAESYEEKKRQSTDTYAKKRDALARNKAKSDKYLDYFLTEKGYTGSGVESDAKLKAELGYGADLSALGEAEQNAASALDSEYGEAKFKNESARAEKLAAADRDYADTAYKAAESAAGDELKAKQIQSNEKIKLAELADEKYLKEKEYEIKLLQAQTEAAKASAKSTDDKKEAEALQEKLDSYRLVLYQYIVSDFESTDDVNEMQRIYDSVTGANTEQATEIYGQKLYSDMVKKFRSALQEAKTAKRDAEVVQMLYDKFVAAKDEYHGDTYMKLKRALQTQSFPGYTLDQLDRAYKLYRTNN